MKVVMCISPNKHFADLFNIKMATHAAAADVVDSHPAQQLIILVLTTVKPFTA